MKFEHFAINVADVKAQAAWWVEHLGMKVARKREDFPFTQFLADETGRVIIELYSNTTAAIPDYFSMHHLVFHVAFVSADSQADRKRLEAAGAIFVVEDKLPDGSSLVMMRDPWGVCLQFCQRNTPF